MHRNVAIISGWLLLITSRGLADWVDLKSGVSLRGIDLQEKGKNRIFTLETGETVRIGADQIAGVRKSPPDEKVEVDGKEVTLREKVRLLKEQAKKRQDDAVRDFESWARGGKGADEAKTRFSALPDDERERYLAAVLSKSKTSAARVMAARELAHHKSKRSAYELVWAAVNDSQKPVREESVASLKTLDDPSAPEQFIPFLKSASQDQRTRAMAALEVVPTRKAVPVLIETLRYTWTGFGRGFISRTEDRAYIHGYNLVSGGTGFSIVEVADPEIRTVQTGVALDAKVNKVEMETRVRALRAITGQDFGTDAEKWSEWWRANGKE